MHPLLRYVVTPVATGTAVVVGVTGGLMFFHLFEGQVKELHEWLGIVSVVAVTLHLVRNRAALLAYFRRGWAMPAALAVSGLVAAGFVGGSMLGGEPGRPDPRALYGVLEQATLAELAPVLDVPQGTLLERLEAAGVAGASPTATVRQLADGASLPSPVVLQHLLGDAR